MFWSLIWGLRGWFSLGLGLRDGLCLPLEVVNCKSGIQLQSSVFIISPDHSWGIVGNCWSISQQWWMNWRTGTSWGNGVVFSCQISEIWFHGIGNTLIQVYISYVYVFFLTIRKFELFYYGSTQFPSSHLVTCIYYITLIHVHTRLYVSLFVHDIVLSLSLGFPLFYCLFLYTVIITHHNTYQ